MQYSVSTLNKKANKAGYSLQKGYQRYLHTAWGCVRDESGMRIRGYQIFDYLTGCLVWGTYNDLYDHVLDFDDALDLLTKLCKERGVVI